MYNQVCFYFKVEAAPTEYYSSRKVFSQILEFHFEVDTIVEFFNRLLLIHHTYFNTSNCINVIHQRHTFEWYKVNGLSYNESCPSMWLK